MRQERGGGRELTRGEDGRGEDGVMEGCMKSGKSSVTRGKRVYY